MCRFVLLATIIFSGCAPPAPDTSLPSVPVDPQSVPGITLQGECEECPPLPTVVEPPPIPFVFSLSHARDSRSRPESLCISDRGTIERLVTTTSGGFGCVSVSPDNRFIAFVANLYPDSSGRFVNDVFIYDQSQRLITNVTDDAANQLSCSWSIDSMSLAIVTEDGEDVEKASRLIELINKDGTARRRLNLDTIEVDDLDWSTTTDQLVFVGSAKPRRDADGNHSQELSYGLYTMETDGANLQCIEESKQWSNRPRWSPDGRHICFGRHIGKELDHSEIWIIGAGGADPRQITDLGGVNSDPCFAPDGETIIFHHYESRQNQGIDDPRPIDLYSVNIRTGTLVRHTHNTEQRCAFPVFLRAESGR